MLLASARFDGLALWQWLVCGQNARGLLTIWRCIQLTGMIFTTFCMRMERKAEYSDKPYLKASTVVVDVGGLRITEQCCCHIGPECVVNNGIHPTCGLSLHAPWSSVMFPVDFERSWTEKPHIRNNSSALRHPALVEAFPAKAPALR